MIAARRSHRLLFFASVTALYTEMVLIRWLGTEVRIFAYVQNLALIACFLGFGVGCYHSTRPIFYRVGTWAICGLVLVASLPATPWQKFLSTISQLLTFSPDGALWSSAYLGGYPPRILMILAVVVITWLLVVLIGVMLPFGQLIGRALEQSDNVVSAYSVNLAGSLVGIWLAAALSFLWTSPVTWLVLLFTMVLIVRGAKPVVIAVSCIALALSFFNLKPLNGGAIIWSPYQKLSLTPLPYGNYGVGVNNTSYMNLANFTAEAPSIQNAAFSESSYDSPFKFAIKRDRVLVVGSGGGNDIAASLRHGAGHIDAVEIDPAILSLGKRYHPDRPYHSSRVQVIVNDARNFMRTTDQRYDLVIFGLLDSHTGFSPQSNMRIDNYVYTEESLREAIRLLNPGGLLIIKFEVRPPWLWMGQRFDFMLTRISGRAPVVYYVPDIRYFTRATVFLTSNSPELWQRAQSPELASFLQAHPPVFDRTSSAPPPTSDDWPYVYHRSHNVPRAYLTVTAILLVIALALVGPTIKGRSSSTWHFLFLGAGFLGLETQMVSRLALYFGSTWLVNCFVISAVLVVLVSANVFVEHKRTLNCSYFYAALLISLLAIYIFPWAHLPFGVVQIGLLLIAAYAVPLFCAGVIFTDSFRRSIPKSSALGANLLGSTFGGMAQNLSFIFGLKSLLLLAAAFYGLAWLFSSVAEKIRAPRPPIAYFGR